MSNVFTKAQAKASDARLAELYKAKYAAQGRVTSARHSVWINSGYTKRYSGRTSQWVAADGTAVTFDDALAKAAAMAADERLMAHSREGAQRAVDAFNAATDALDDAETAVYSFTEWEDNGRWSRFFLVSGGHIHSSTGCHTLYPTTEIAWLPDLSGESEADAVAAHGALLCTICFPSAPVEWTDGRKADDDLYCVGQRPVPGSYNPRRYSPYGECVECGQTVSVTKTGKVRKHKKSV